MQFVVSVLLIRAGKAPLGLLDMPILFVSSLALSRFLTSPAIFSFCSHAEGTMNDVVELLNITYLL